MKNYLTLLFLTVIACVLAESILTCGVNSLIEHEAFSVNTMQTPLVIFQEHGEKLNDICQENNITFPFKIYVVPNNSMTISWDSRNTDDNTKGKYFWQSCTIILCAVTVISVFMNATLCYYTFKQDSSQVQQPPPEIPPKDDGNHLKLPNISDNLRDPDDHHYVRDPGDHRYVTEEDTHQYLPMDIKNSSKGEITHNQDLEDDDSNVNMHHHDQHPRTNVSSYQNRKNVSMSGEYVQPKAVRVPVVAVMRNEGLISGNVIPEEARATSAKSDKIDDYEYLNVKTEITEKKDIKNDDYTNLPELSVKDLEDAEYTNINHVSIQENLQNSNYTCMKKIKVPKNPVSVHQSEIEPVYSNLPHINSKP